MDSFILYFISLLAVDMIRHFYFSSKMF